jgi:hypothetical protein
LRVDAFLRSYGVLYASALLVGMYCTIDVTARSPVSPVLQLVVSWGIATCVAVWTVQDARSRRCTPCFDFGMFVFFTWFMAVPCDLIATRGWRGLLIIVTTLFTMVVTMIGIIVVCVLAGLVA